VNNKPLNTANALSESMPKVQGPSGRLVEAVPVDFDADAEPWQTYSLSDGSVVKIRYTPTGFIRLEGEYDAGGHPLYVSHGITMSRVVKSKIKGEPTVMQKTEMPSNDPAVG